MRCTLESQELSPALRVTVEPTAGTRGVEDRRIAVDHRYFRARSRLISTGGVVVIHGTNRALVDLELTSEQLPPPVILALTVDGSVPEQTDRRSAPHLVPRSHGIFYLPEPRSRFRLAGGRRRSVFEVNLSTEYLRGLLDRFPLLADTGLAALHREGRVSLQSFPGGLTASMLDIAREILESELHGPARAMYIEAKVVELLALQLGELGPQRGLAPERRALSRTQIERMREARERLLERLVNPPSLAELASLVGTNEFALKRDFKALFGTTVYGLLLDRRMEIARGLLRDSAAAIEEIAEQVGYSSAAHFSNAFVRKFGYRPSRLRPSGR